MSDEPQRIAFPGRFDQGAIRSALLDHHEDEDLIVQVERDATYNDKHEVVSEVESLVVIVPAGAPTKHIEAIVNAHPFHPGELAKKNRQKQIAKHPLTPLAAIIAAAKTPADSHAALQKWAKEHLADA